MQAAAHLSSASPVPSPWLKPRLKKRFVFHFLPPSAQVVSFFVSTTFDPYVAQQPGSGVTRLAFSSPEDGSPLVLANLSTPVVFSIPATNYTLSASGGRGAKPALEASCVFWDEKSSAYRCGTAVNSRAC